MRPRRFCWFLAALLSAAPALGQGPGGPAGGGSGPSLPEVEDDEPPPPPPPPAPDTLGGHFVAGVSGLVRLPFGQLRQSEKATNLGPGLGGMLDLGFGLSRSVAVGAWGELSTHGTGEGGYALGPFVRYHLVQG